MTVQILRTGWERWECLRRRGTNGKRMTDFDSLQQANLFRWASASVDAWVMFWLIYESYVDYHIVASEPFQVSICLCWRMSHMFADVWVICWLPHPSKSAFSGEHPPLLMHESFGVLMYESYVDYRILAREPFQVSIRPCWCTSHMLVDLWVICWLPHRSKRTFSGEHPPLLTHESCFGWCMRRLLITASYRIKLDRWPCHVTFAKKKACFL